jgi:hypothetical protein
MREFVGKQEEQHTHRAATARSNDLIRATWTARRTGPRHLVELHARFASFRAARPQGRKSMPPFLKAQRGTPNTIH